MDRGELIIKMGQVEYVEDSADGLRLKIRISQDGNESIENIPYAFPFLPKTFQSVPKVGEGAFVLTTYTGDKQSQRYYIGPIISQPQFQGKCEFQHGRGNATSLLTNGLIEPLGKISNNKSTWGSFPKREDVAIIGRGSQDIVMHNNESTTSNELDLRCGIRQTSTENNTDLIGKVIYNALDPTYIQLKYKRNLSTGNLQEANSMVNVVADKINIISNKDENAFNLTDINELIPEDQLDEIMGKLHRLAHGDTLVELLKLIIKAIVTHVHPYAAMPPVIDGYVKEMVEYEVEKIMSKHVRIS